jgi:hypothetical protein
MYQSRFNRLKKRRCGEREANAAVATRKTSLVTW